MMKIFASAVADSTVMPSQNLLIAGKYSRHLSIPADTK